MTAKEVLVLGVGNDLLGDDAVGLIAAARLAEAGLPVRTTSRSGLALLDEVVGFRRVLLLDSQVTGRAPGTLTEFTLDPERVRSPSAHYVGYGEALTIAAAVGLALPEEVRVLAIECSPALDFGSDLSEAVSAALPALLERAGAIVRDWSAQPAAASDSREAAVPARE